jgi:hypothetical protein
MDNGRLSRAGGERRHRIWSTGDLVPDVSIYGTLRPSARAKFEDGLIVTAGTINPHLPRKAVPSEGILAWLEFGQAPEPTASEPTTKTD